jgi:hypothetical protein
LRIPPSRGQRRTRLIIWITGEPVMTRFADALVISFGVLVLDVRRDGAPEVPVPAKNVVRADTIELAGSER